MERLSKKYLPFAGVLLFAIYPIVALYAHNVEEVNLKVIGLPLLISVLGSIFVFSFWYVIIRNLYKASLLTIALLWIAGFYGTAFTTVSGWLTVSHLHLIIIITIIYAGWIYLIIKIKRNETLANLNLIFTLPVALLLILNLANIIPAEIDKNRITIKTANAEYIPGQNPELTSGLPDLYILVFDEFASFKTIDEVWGYKNSSLHNFLTEKGFYIAEDSRTRFRTSYSSLASLMNLDYVAEGTSLGEALQIYDNNFVMNYLDSLGYNITFINGYGSFGWSGRLPDVNYMYMYNMGIEESSTIDPFHVLLVNQTILTPWAESFKDKTPNLYYQVNKYFFDYIENHPFTVNKMDNPSLLYAHMMSPHLPYVFDREGNFLENPTNHWEYTTIDDETKKQLYLEQFIYVSKRMEKMVESILANSDTPPVILLLSDHGVREESTGSREKEHIYRVLNAVYLPDGDYSGFHSGIAPLNTLRIIFNNYFGQDYEMRPDQ